MSANTTYPVAEFAWASVSTGPVHLNNVGLYPVEVVVSDVEPNQNINGNVVRSKETFNYGGTSNLWVRTQKASVRVPLIVSEED